MSHAWRAPSIMKEVLVYTHLPGELKKQLEAVCVLLGIKKKHLVEEAVREKIEEIMATHDLVGKLLESE